MLLCLDVGNTHIVGGVFEGDQIITRFRYNTHMVGTADQLGIFLTSILNLNDVDRKKIKAVAISSVVPIHDYTIRHAIIRYFDVPLFSIKAGIKTGLNVKVATPAEIGADRIANAIGAVQAFPKKNIVIVDMGTATTVCAITKKNDYLGGAIYPGMRLGMEALSSKTAKLMDVVIEDPGTYVGRTTKDNIQAGLYYAHLGALRELINGTKREAFNNEESVVVATGGFAQLFKDQGVFDVILPDLVLQGLAKAYEMSL